jgi:hypothetical protein
MAQEAKYHDGTFPNVKRLREWIKQNVRLDLFGPELATTQPKVHAKLAKLQAEGITPVQISGHWQSKDGVLGTDSYKEAGKQKCKSTEVAFLVYGDEVEVVEICRDKKACKTHYKWEVEQATARRRQLGRDKETPEKKKRRLAAEAKVKAANAVYKDVVQRALRAAIKRTKKVTPAMLTRLVLNTLDRYNFDEDTDQLLADLKIPQKALGLSYDMLRKGDLPRLSEQQLAALVILAEGDAMEFPNNAPDLDAFCKRHKLDLKKLKADALAAAAKAKESEPQKLTAPKKK